MGVNASKVDHSVTNENVMDIMSEQLQKGSQSLESSIATLSTNDVTIGTLNLGDCKLSISNFGEVKQVTNGEFKAENISEMETEVNNALVENYKKKLEQTSDLGLSVNSDVDDGAIRNAVEMSTKTELSQDSVQELASELVVIQGNKVKFDNINCPPGAKGEVDISNKLVIDQLTEGLMENIQKNLNKQKILSDIDRDYDLDIKQENKGVFGSVDNFTNALVSIAKSPIFIVGAVIVTFLLIFFFAFKSPAGQKLASQVGNGNGNGVRGNVDVTNFKAK
jgi:hypothetical protein